MSKVSTHESTTGRLCGGWIIGETDPAARWRVFGTNGEKVIDVTAATQAEAWWRAYEAARALGLLGASVSSSRVRQFFD